MRFVHCFETAPLQRTKRHTVIDDMVVKLAAEYLDRHVGGETQATLMGMIREIDFVNRTPPRFEEVNKALKSRASVYVHRVKTEFGGTIEFRASGSERKITFADMESAYADYRDWLDIETERLKAEKT
jgi:hypothetical protein